ncbi:hypothetical protein V5F53_01115 [Xanthobacter sp. V4C-4]|uniref:hypothetical protein n=1 Tax=Xanthobacter cornucopiae TaxID=3119924 RepID=UPI00372A910A
MDDTRIGTGVAPTWLNEAVGGAALARLKSHPGFPSAVAASAVSLVELYSGNRLLNRVLNDRGRVLFGFFALYLDALPEAEGGGLTVSRMAALAAETGVCSRGRAKAMLALMRWGGYLAPADTADDRRLKPLVPTPRMVSQQCQRWQAQYRVIAMLDPRIAPMPAALCEREMFDALVIALATAFRAGYRVLGGMPRLADIADRDSGLMILIALLVAEAEGRDMPSIAELARRFHVSRAHVLQLLKDAEAGDLVARGEGGGAGQLTPAGHAALDDFFVASFAFLAGAAGAALEQVAARRARAATD